MPDGEGADTDGHGRDPLTVLLCLRAWHFAVVCAGCGHTGRPDLYSLRDGGHADTPLSRLPLACPACGSSDWSEFAADPPEGF